MLFASCHLDPTNRNDAIRRQTSDIMDFLKEVLEEVSGGVNDEINCGLILTGDFNSNSPTTKTNDLLKV